MKVLFSRNDLVALSSAQAILEQAGVACLVLDRHASAMVGSLAILPCRLMVPDDDWVEAKTILREAGLA